MSVTVLLAIVWRELLRFRHQTSRLVSALVRPTLWLVVFSAGFQNVLGISITPPYATYITYDVYMLPGLLGMVLLFQGMQSSLALVFDREAGMLRLLLTAPTPRWFVLLAKLVAAAVLSVVQAYVFLIVAALFGVDMPRFAALTLLPALVLAGFTLGAVGLLLTVYVRRMENFAGTMNFVIFPAFFFSTALYPTWKVQDSGATWILAVIRLNPFTYVVEMIRFAAYGRFDAVSWATTAAVGLAAFLLSVRGYDPQKGMLGRKPRDEG
ncbi:ABC transporter permease [Lichenibacterium ramalinae]|uniref:Transport permease protein n=1 Tax=Lichenibacterium ramalinae TaxID=2316527 RepID=A0A4Q2RCE6_9HYPH|nr:ABC transporter permease [Lichenibacterium ramalinae]RYB05180.1 multidrug ABC transporter permease [Lichenibacterium ramalinae]